MRPASEPAVAACKPWTREQIAARPRATSPKAGTSISASAFRCWWPNHVPPDAKSIIHSENGILGMGPAPAPDKINRWLINASKQYVTLRSGRRVHAPRRQLRHDPRRPSRSVRARRFSGRRERRFRQLVEVRDRHAVGRRRDGSRRRGEERCGW